MEKIEGIKSILSKLEIIINNNEDFSYDDFEIRTFGSVIYISSDNKYLLDELYKKIQNSNRVDNNVIITII